MLFIAQHLVGLRDVGDDPGTQVNAVNAASIKQDSGFDVISIAAVLYIVHYLVSLRDDCLTLLASGTPPQR